MPGPRQQAGRQDPMGGLTMHNNTPPNRLQNDPELGPTLSAINRLAESERAEPDEGFEARLVAAGRPGVVAKIDDHRPSRPASLWWAIPVAAALTIGVFILRTGPSPASSPADATLTLAAVESDFESFLFIDEFTDSQSVLTDGTDTDDAAVATPADEFLFDLLSTEGSTL